MVREDMREKGFCKHPAQSWIVCEKKINTFYPRDGSHPQEKDIHRGLEIMILECLKIGYEPDTSFVLHEVEEYHKKNFLFHHSAKLAATYGMLMTKPGKPIRIVKFPSLWGLPFIPKICIYCHKEGYISERFFWISLFLQWPVLV